MKIVLIIFFILPMQLISQSIWYRPGIEIYIYHDMHSSTTYYAFDSETDRGKLGRLYCGLMSRKIYTDKEFDSIYLTAKYYYKIKNFDVTEGLLNMLINYKGTDKEPKVTTETRGIFLYSLSDAYYLLRDVLFEQKKYQRALEINTEMFDYIMPKLANAEDEYTSRFKENNIKFSAKCFLELGKYDTAIACSRNYMNDSLMVEVFVKSLKQKVDKYRLNEAMLAEYDKIVVPKGEVIYDSTDINNIKMRVELKMNYITIALFENVLHIYLKEIEDVNLELAEGKITSDIAIMRVKETFKHHLLYKLIMEQ